MSNTVNVGFSNNGQNSHYIVDNNELATELGVVSGSILGSTYISQNVTGGMLSDPYDIPATTVATGGTVSADYTTMSTYDEAYVFAAEGWNKVKNITVKASGEDSMLFMADNFVQADLDFARVKNDVELWIQDGKRSNVLTGIGDDIVRITSATNNPDWSNLHKIRTGNGDDLVVVEAGDETLIPTTAVNFVNGMNTKIEVDLGNGKDTYSSGDDGFQTRDHIHGGRGSDTIFTGEGEDVLYGDSDTGEVNKLGAGLYEVASEGDHLSGGENHDEFHYSVGDHFGIVIDGFDHILDFAEEDILILDGLTDSDTFDTEAATLQTASGDLSGIMVLINSEASVFLEDYTGSTSEIFV